MTHGVPDCLKLSRSKATMMYTLLNHLMDLENPRRSTDVTWGHQACQPGSRQSLNNHQYHLNTNPSVQSARQQLPPPTPTIRSSESLVNDISVRARKNRPSTVPATVQKKRRMDKEYPQIYRMKTKSQVMHPHHLNLSRLSHLVRDSDGRLGPPPENILIHFVYLSPF